MNAFIIKNKEGKYFDRKEGVFCELDYVFRVHIFNTIDDIKYCIDYYGLKDCEPVEITIAEGDLEQEIKHLKRLLDAKTKIETNAIKEIEKLKKRTCREKQRDRKVGRK